MRISDWSSDVCSSDLPQTKRFILQTEHTSGANDTVGFGDGSIRITGRGEYGRDSSGAPRSAFDPAKPVTVRFTQLGRSEKRRVGKECVSTGRSRCAPLH